MIANKMELCDRLLARGLGQGQTGRKDICLHEKYDQADTEPRATMASAVRMEATPDKAQYKDETTCDKANGPQHQVGCSYGIEIIPHDHISGFLGDFCRGAARKMTEVF